ncbi:MAG: U32 family peptidase [Oscillospiraceae bacterium]|nr:U32 family peptidase [Oscillospiraceae bacterium]
MLELLSHVGSAEAVRAAVQSGANAVYVGFGEFCTRGKAQGYTEEEFAAAARYCRVRGCKLYFTLDTLVNDDELEAAVALAVKAAKYGADAIVLQDPGLVSILRKVLPDMPLHGSVRMDIHSLAGVNAAAEMGLSRVILAPELSRHEIAHIAAASPIELGVHAHGGLCVCHAGQCYMSALVNGSSDNRGQCAQPCLLDYSLGGRMDDHPLSMRDNCLVQHLKMIEDIGIRCVLLDGFDKRAEYISMVTGMYAQAMRDGKAPSESELGQLCEIFTRQGFTQGYFSGELGKAMFGVHESGEKGNGRLLFSIRRRYANAEKRRVPIRMRALVHANKPVIFTAKDDLGNSVIVRGDAPVPANGQPLTASALHAQLYKTAGTPYLCTDVESDVHSGLSVPVAEINNLRNQLLAKLSEKRAVPPAQRVSRAPECLSPVTRPEVPELNIQISDLSQLSPELAALSPTRIYIPLELFSDITGELNPFENADCAIVAVLPRIIQSREEASISAMLSACARFGVKEALLGNLGHVLFARKAGLGIRGDFGLNLCNSYALDVATRAGFLSATASFELHIDRIRDMSKSLPLEMLAYGRIPLMITENCIIQNSYGQCNCKNQINHLTDQQGAGFPVLPAFGCRNQIFHAKKLFLADKPVLFRNSGVSAARLLFTTESARECVEVTKSYLGMSDYIPNGITRGAYFRGV